MKRLHILKESLVAALFTLLVTFLVSFLPFKFEFSKGIRQEFLGFDVYDLYYTKKHLASNKRDDRIVLIGLGSNRDSIAAQIELIEKYKPAVIGVDIVFERPGELSENARLLETISRYNNIVYGSRFWMDAKTKQSGIINSFFAGPGQTLPIGFCNLVGNEFSVIRKFPPIWKIGDSTYKAFATAIAEKYSSLAYNRLMKRDRKSELINYQGNIGNYTAIPAAQLEYFDKENQLGTIVKDKIVLLGFFVKDPPLIMEDLHFTPLNENVAGKSYPDMYGVVVHANILSMILDGCYANEASEFTGYAFAAVFIILFLWYMLSQYNKPKHPSHGKFMLIQFLGILLLLYLFLLLFKATLLKVPLLPLMISMVLCLELLGVYKNIALWMHRKFKYKTVFSHQHII